MNPNSFIVIEVEVATANGVAAANRVAIGVTGSGIGFLDPMSRQYQPRPHIYIF